MLQALNHRLLQDMPALCNQVASYAESSPAAQMRTLQYLVHNYPHNYVQTVTFHTNSSLMPFWDNVEELIKLLRLCKGGIVRLVIDGKAFTGATALGLLAQMEQHRTPHLTGYIGNIKGSNVTVFACLVSDTLHWLHLRNAHVEVRHVAEHSRFVKYAKPAFLVDARRPMEHGNLPVGLLHGDSSVVTVGTALDRRAVSYMDFLALGQRIPHKSQWLSVSEDGWVGYCPYSGKTMWKRPDGIPRRTTMCAIKKLSYRPVFLYTDDPNRPWRYICHGREYKLDELLAFYTAGDTSGGGWRRQEDYPHAVLHTNVQGTQFWT